METTLLIGDRLIVTKYDYWIKEPTRGEIIVFKSLGDRYKFLIKRVIGLPGEEVKIENNKIYIDGKLIQEEYIKNTIEVSDYGPVNVPVEHYFMLGDNRNNSCDSREWGFLSKNLIVGKARYIYWPLNRVGRIQ